MKVLEQEGLVHLLTQIPNNDILATIIDAIDVEKQNTITSISLTGDVEGAVELSDNPSSISLNTSLKNALAGGFEIDYKIYSIIANLIKTSNIATTSLGAVEILLAQYDAIIRANSDKLNTFSITYNLNHLSSNTSINSIIQHEQFTCTLTPENGYVIESVTVLINNVNVTSAFYKNGVITIPYCYGDIIITAVAEEGEEVEIPTNGVLLTASNFSIGSGSPTITTDDQGYLVITFNAVGEYFMVRTPGMTQSSTIRLHSIGDYVCDQATDGLGFYNEYGWCYLSATTLMNSGNGVYFMLKDGDYGGSVPVTIKMKNVILTVQ